MKGNVFTLMGSGGVFRGGIQLVEEECGGKKTLQLPVRADDMEYIPQCAPSQRIGVESGYYAPPIVGDRFLLRAQPVKTDKTKSNPVGIRLTGKGNWWGVILLVDFRELNFEFPPYDLQEGTSLNLSPGIEGHVPAARYGFQATCHQRVLCMFEYPFSENVYIVDTKAMVAKLVLSLSEEPVIERVPEDPIAEFLFRKGKEQVSHRGMTWAIKNLEALGKSVYARELIRIRDERFPRARAS